MTAIRREIEIAATPTAVFALLVDLDRLPDWSTITSQTHDRPSGPLKTGDTFAQTLRVLGRAMESEWRVTELHAPFRVAYEATGPLGARMKMRQTVQDAHAGSSVAFEVDYELPGGLIGDLADFVAGERNERELEHSMQNLKDLAENSR